MLRVDARPVAVVDNSVTLDAGSHGVHANVETLSVRSYSEAGAPFTAGDDISIVLVSALAASRNSVAAGHDPETASDDSAPARATLLSVGRRVVARAANSVSPGVALVTAPEIV